LARWQGWSTAGPSHSETWDVAVVYLAGMPRSLNIHACSRVIGKSVVERRNQ
jgi:hypothetical protein